MTTLFENLNEQLFTDISSEQAEMIHGGYFVAFKDKHPDDDAAIAYADRGLPKLKYNNAISHFHITEGTWRVYDRQNYDENGSYKDYGPGQHDLINDTWSNGPGKGTKVNNDISSFRKIA